MIPWLQPRRCGTIQQENGVGMRAQNAGLCAGVNILQNCLAHRVGFIRSGSDQQHAFGVHDAANAQAYGPAGNILLPVKKAAVRFNRTLRLGYDVAAVHKLVGGFVKTDVPVAADTQ